MGASQEIIVERNIWWKMCLPSYGGYVPRSDRSPKRKAYLKPNNDRMLSWGIHLSDPLWPNKNVANPGLGRSKQSNR